MYKNFWRQLKKPIFVLAPMANVTDASFRHIIAKYGKPDVTWTEFVSVEGLIATTSPTSLKLRGADSPLLLDLKYDESERPIVAQIFGGKPEQFYEVAKLCVELGFDGIDINMGCPDKGVEKSGGGAAMIKNPALAQKIILETKRGVADAGSEIPVSVKTRLGYNKNEMETWIPALLEAKPAALTLHLRTRKEMSLVPAHWEVMERAVALRNQHAPETLILGNGDVKDIAEARKKVAETGCDGVMLGRGIFGNPWLFAEKVPSTEEKLRVAVEHTKLFEKMYGPSVVIPATEPESIPTKSDFVGVISGSRVKPGMTQIKWLKPFDLMKKHFKAYVNNFDGAKELRIKMMEAETPEQIENLVNEFLKM